MTFCIASLPRSQHTNTLVVITTLIFCRFMLGLSRHSEAQKLNTYQSWEKKNSETFFFGYWTSSYSSILMVLFGSADGEWKRRSLLPTSYTTSHERCYLHSGPTWQSFWTWQWVNCKGRADFAPGWSSHRPEIITFKSQDLRGRKNGPAVLKRTGAHHCKKHSPSERQVPQRGQI